VLLNNLTACLLHMWLGLLLALLYGYAPCTPMSHGHMRQEAVEGRVGCLVREQQLQLQLVRHFPFLFLRLLGFSVRLLACYLLPCACCKCMSAVNVRAMIICYAHELHRHGRCMQQQHETAPPSC
jgi:hypothetical protein